MSPHSVRQPWWVLQMGITNRILKSKDNIENSFAFFRLQIIHFKQFIFSIHDRLVYAFSSNVIDTKRFQTFHRVTIVKQTLFVLCEILDAITSQTAMNKFWEEQTLLFVLPFLFLHTMNWMTIKHFQLSLYQMSDSREEFTCANWCQWANK